MADIFNADKRSEIMSKIRGKNTKVEVLVYRYLRHEGIYFRKHYRTRKEKVVLDIAQPRRKKAVFIDGDFWHGRTIEKVRARRGDNDFWTKKLERNIQRDRDQYNLLSENGWSILRVWETSLTRASTRQHELDEIATFLR